MSKSQMHDFAATPRTGLPKYSSPMKKSTMGSPAFSKQELMQGHRKMASCPMGKGRMTAEEVREGEGQTAEKKGRGYK